MPLSQHHRNKEARRPRAEWANVRAAGMPANVSRDGRSFSAARIAQAKRIGAAATAWTAKVDIEASIG
jgi:hypothetical protein